MYVKILMSRIFMSTYVNVGIAVIVSKNSQLNHLILGDDSYTVSTFYSHSS